MKVKVFEVKTGKPMYIDPLEPEERKVFSWRCNRCKQVHKSYSPCAIFDMTEEGKRPAECVK